MPDVQARPGPTLKDYVRLELAVTIAHITRGAFAAPDTAQEEQRLQRAEAYARWRWRAYMAGEVAAL